MEIRDYIKTVDVPINSTEYSIAVKKGNIELLKRINRGLKEIKENGTYEIIYRKWFGYDINYSRWYVKKVFTYHLDCYYCIHSFIVNIFYIELSEKGTLFLDEIGDMDINLQTKLLRVLQDKEIRPVGSSSLINVDFRFIAATNKNLIQEIEKKILLS